MPTVVELPDALEFGNRLRRVLVARGMAERGADKALADTYGVKPPVVSAWFAGRHLPSHGKVRHMASTFKVPFDWLYWGDGPDPLTTNSGADNSSQSARLFADNLEEALKTVVDYRERKGFDPAILPADYVFQVIDWLLRDGPKPVANMADEREKRKRGTDRVAATGAVGDAGSAARKRAGSTKTSS